MLQIEWEPEIRDKGIFRYWPGPENYLLDEFKPPQERYFDFRANWSEMVAPVLNEPEIQAALESGLERSSDGHWPGRPPWEYGKNAPNSLWHEQFEAAGSVEPEEGSLEWYQPFAGCHLIAPFCWAVGRRLFPELNWGLIRGESHSIAVGYRDAWETPDWSYCQKLCLSGIEEGGVLRDESEAFTSFRPVPKGARHHDGTYHWSLAVAIGSR